MDRGEPLTPAQTTDAALATKAAGLMGMPVEVIAAIFAAKDSSTLNALMDRSFGPEYDDVILQSLVTLTNGFSHALERHRRRRNMKPLKLRCMECQSHG